MRTDEVWPRDEEHRFRLYARRGEVLRIVAAGPSLESVGVAFAQAIWEEEFSREDSVGVLDVRPHLESGSWLVSPFA